MNIKITMIYIIISRTNSEISNQFLCLCQWLTMLMSFAKSLGENANYELHLLASHQVCTQNKSTTAGRPQIRVCWEQQLYFRPACIVKCSCHQPNAGTGNSKANWVESLKEECLCGTAWPEWCRATDNTSSSIIEYDKISKSSIWHILIGLNHLKWAWKGKSQHCYKNVCIFHTNKRTK